MALCLLYIYFIFAYFTIFWNLAAGICSHAATKALMRLLTEGGCIPENHAFVTLAFIVFNIITCCRGPSPNCETVTLQLRWVFAEGYVATTMTRVSSYKLPTDRFFKNVPLWINVSPASVLCVLLVLQALCCEKRSSWLGLLSFQKTLYLSVGLSVPSRQRLGPLWVPEYHGPALILFT